MLYEVITLKRRSSDKVKFETKYDTDTRIEIPLNAALFSWVIENICKNAIDAMGNNGTIVITSYSIHYTKLYDAATRRGTESGAR